MTLRVEQERRRAPRQSERTRLDPFVVIGGDASPRDQRDLMERPFFSLSKSPRTKPILYRADDVEVQVFGMPNHGMATIWDADVLIWAASQIAGPRIWALPLRASSASRRINCCAYRPPDRQSAMIVLPESGARPAAIDGYRHHHSQRRALAAAAILLDQRMGGDVDVGRPRRGHGIRRCPTGSTAA